MRNYVLLHFTKYFKPKQLPSKYTLVGSISFILMMYVATLELSYVRNVMKTKNPFFNMFSIRWQLFNNVFRQMIIKKYKNVSLANKVGRHTKRFLLAQKQ